MRLAGYAAIFDHPDHGGDVIRKGAFASARAGIPLYWQHDSARRIGTVDWLAEDARGLRVIASLGTRIAVQAGDGLSFGYRVRHHQPCGTYRQLDDLELIEVSLVKNPMQPLARVLAVEHFPSPSGEGEGEGSTQLLAGGESPPHPLP